MIGNTALTAALLLASATLAQAPPTNTNPPGTPIRVHDPSTIIKHKDVYWIFSTGMGVASLRSKNLIDWEAGPAVFSAPPKWINDVVAGHRGYFWAPDATKIGDRYMVYYSVSAFGKNTSAIAMASSPTLDPADAAFKWTDHGIVIRSSAKDDFNAIDPALFHDPNGSLWMAFGSFWSGIKLVELDPKSGLRKSLDSPIHSLANKEQIEAVAIHRHGDFYYQFVNWGWCCRGIRSTYNIRVGRSKDVRGPYLDREGKDLRHGGGALLLATEGRFIGPGHPGLYQDGDRLLMSYHFYDEKRGGRPRLAIRKLSWTEDGWPKLDGPPLLPKPDNP